MGNTAGSYGRVFDSSANAAPDFGNKALGLCVTDDCGVERD